MTTFSTYSQLYGTRGQDQQGIDLYARKPASSRYTVFQCKKVQRFTPTQIKKAVDEFIGEEWAKKTDTFVLCTSVSLTPEDRADAVRTQGERLRAEGISFVPWDRSLISKELKTHPELVHDFFGREWVRAFCGEQAAQVLSKRLQPPQVTTLRVRLSQCYRRIFDAHDPGLPGDTSDQPHPLALKARFVLPDILVPITVGSNGSPSEGDNLQATEGGTGNEKNSSEYKRVDEHSLLRSPHQGRRPQATRSCQMVSGWLNAARRHVVLGLPGSGKSSLLRFIALDLLDYPQCLSAFHQRSARVANHGSVQRHHGYGICLPTEPLSS